MSEALRDGLRVHELIYVARNQGSDSPGLYLTGTLTRAELSNGQQETHMSSTNEQATQTATQKAPKKSRPSSPKGSSVGDPKKGILPSKVAKLATKAEKIRALWMTSKWTRCLLYTSPSPRD